MKTAFYFLLAIGLAACTPIPHKPEPSNAETRALWPVDLHFSDGGYVKSSCDIKWERDHLVYRHTFFGNPEHTITTIIKPTATEWKEFWREMGAVDIWKWQTRYVTDVMTIDGYGWQFALSHRGDTMKSEGDNAYPSDTDPRKTARKTIEPSKRFNNFYDALTKLVREKSK